MAAEIHETGVVCGHVRSNDHRKLRKASHVEYE